MELAELINSTVWLLLGFLLGMVFNHYLNLWLKKDEG